MLRFERGAGKAMLSPGARFSVTIALLVVLMIYFPQIALWLPGQMMGR